MNESSFTTGINESFRSESSEKKSLFKRKSIGFKNSEASSINLSSGRTEM